MTSAAALSYGHTEACVLVNSNVYSILLQKMMAGVTFFDNLITFAAPHLIGSVFLFWGTLKFLEKMRNVMNFTVCVRVLAILVYILFVAVTPNLEIFAPSLDYFPNRTET